MVSGVSAGIFKTFNSSAFLTGKSSGFRFCGLILTVFYAYSALFVPLRMPGTSLCPLDASDQLPRSSDESCVSSIWLHVPSPSASLVSNITKACIWSLESCVFFNSSAQLPLAANIFVMLHMPPPIICPCCVPGLYASR